MLSVSSALKLIGEHVPLPLGRNCHYKQSQFYGLLFVMSAVNWFAEGVSNFLCFLGNVNPQADSLLYHLKKMPVEQVQNGFDKLIARSVKILRRLGLIRRFVWIAVDFNEQEYYGEPNERTRGGKWKNGTSNFYSYATANIVAEGVRLVIAQLPYLPLDDKTEVVRRLLGACRKLVGVELVLFDRGFFSKGVIALLESKRLKYVMPAVRNNVVKRLLASVKTFPATLEYEMGGQQLRLVFIQVKKDGELKTLAFCTNLQCWRSKLTEYYSKRWGVETAYRVTGDFTFKTCSANETIRLFLFYFAVALYNSWVLANAERPCHQHLPTVAVRLAMLYATLTQALNLWPPPH